MTTQPCILSFIDLKTTDGVQQVARMHDAIVEQGVQDSIGMACTPCSCQHTRHCGTGSCARGTPYRRTEPRPLGSVLLLHSGLSRPWLTYRPVSQPIISSKSRDDSWRPPATHRRMELWLSKLYPPTSPTNADIGIPPSGHTDHYSN
jgi:hypothetical protein